MAAVVFPKMQLPNSDPCAHEPRDTCLVLFTSLSRSEQREVVADLLDRLDTTASDRVRVPDEGVGRFLSRRCQVGRSDTRLSGRRAHSPACLVLPGRVPLPMSAVPRQLVGGLTIAPRDDNVRSFSRHPVLFSYMRRGGGPVPHPCHP